MIRRRLHLWQVALAVMALALAFASAQAQDDDVYIQHRQKVMKAISGHNGAIAAIVKNKLPYTSSIVAHAQALQLSSTVIEDAFKHKVTEGKTDSQPEIWQDWDKFAEAAKTMGEESGKLADAAQSGDMEAVAALAKGFGKKACGGCHKSFRKPKEESYKKK